MKLAAKKLAAVMLMAAMVGTIPPSLTLITLTILLTPPTGPPRKALPKAL